MAAVSVAEKVAVGNFGGVNLTVDIARPAAGNGPAPALLFLPGGGWQTADRTPLLERYAIPMAEGGYVGVAGEYRVMEQAP